MFISLAHAAAETGSTLTTATGATGMAGQAFALNMALVLVMVVLFYILMIMPQQRRFKEHRALLDSLKKGDKVLTAGGLLGVVDSVDSEKGEVVVDLGNNVKVTALRATIQTKIGDTK